MITCLAFTPHPPIIIPAVGGNRIKAAAATVEGMQEMARQVAATAPETLVFLTPHGNVFRDAVSCLGDSRVYGDMADFNVPDLRTSCPNDLELVARIGYKCAENDIDFVMVDQDNARRYKLKNRLDHGILVPHYYLSQAGLGQLPLAAISIGFLPLIKLYQLGTFIAESAEQLGRRIAVIASGDMSHRLKTEGPYDFHPDGPRYDAEVERLLKAGDTRGLLNIPETLRENAGECGYRSLVIMLGCLDKYSYQSEIFSHEGPFGVGYMTAGLTPQAAATSYLKLWQEENRCENEVNTSIPVRWARQVLKSYLLKGEIPPLPEEFKELKAKKAGTFVSLKKYGSLRGCIGTIMPYCDDLAAEIAYNAVNAGVKDPRFSPVTIHEYDDLEFSVDILGEPEPCRRQDLNPRQYGVIVSKGAKRGLLLPDLEGIDTVEEQLNIALQKAGIKPGEDYDTARFTVTRYK
ncbi:MAG TPA: AmmeMemoRadiSam system protein A [Syntrophomonadaceae bacterium]|nr:AmmeMemoRadiSam system protein A [Syntrophomonadaceae bacterium]HNX29534.1 AmmeMemoRadiSam system protein A [Syntrophomonadaceae bacterium]HPR94132.1 AmmeMemoRadiSam system protein A [Syntrophomonadaceae bacterium]